MAPLTVKQVFDKSFRLKQGVNASGIVQKIFLKNKENENIKLIEHLTNVVQRRSFSLFVNTQNTFRLTMPQTSGRKNFFLAIPAQDGTINNIVCTKTAFCCTSICQHNRYHDAVNADVRIRLFYVCLFFGGS